MTEVVTFNVGGQPYQVSRTLLNSHPETMLAKSASERWQADSDSEIFIERDGEMFRHVLSYLRDGRVDLPVTVTKKWLLSELKYYGVEGVDDDNVDDSLIKAQIPLGIANIHTICDSWKGTVVALNLANMCVKNWLKIQFEEKNHKDLISFQLNMRTFEGDCDPISNILVDCNVHLVKVGIQIVIIIRVDTQDQLPRLLRDYEVTLKSSD